MNGKTCISNAKINHKNHILFFSKLLKFIFYFIESNYFFLNKYKNENKNKKEERKRKDKK